MRKQWWLLTVALTLFPVHVFGIPEIQHWHTDNGLQVYFVPAPELPMLDVRLVFDAGSARDEQQPGLARMTASMLDEGIGEWDTNAIAERFENVGAQFSSSVVRDMAWVSLRTLTEDKYFEPALETFTRVISSVEFDERAFQRIRRQFLIGLQREAQRPGVIAENALYREVYPGHPFANPIKGTVSSIQSITPQDIRKFHQRYYVASNATLALMGDADRSKAELIANRISKGFVAGEAAPPLPKVEPLKESKTVRIPFPSKQAHVYIGQPGVRRGDPDYFQLYVGNHVLGGNGFSSRLVKEIRVNRGLSYSVFSYFYPNAVLGPFELGLQTRIDQVDQAVEVARQIMRDFINKGPSEEELIATKKNITGGFPMRIDSNSDLEAYLAVIGFYGLPLDYLQTFNDKVSAETAGTIQEAFKRRLNVDKMVTVIVGGGEN